MLKLSTIKRCLKSSISTIKKEVKCESKVNFSDETLLFCSEPKCLGVTLDRSLTYRRHLEPLRKKTKISCCSLEETCWPGWSAGATTLRTATSALVNSVAEYCAPIWSRRLTPPHWPYHQRCLANCDWMPASYSSGQPSHPRRHPTCWTSSECSHTVSSTPCHGTCTSAPLSADLSTRGVQLSPFSESGEH